MKKYIFGIAFAIVALALILSAGNIFETNKAGFYQVKQQFWVGDLTVRNAPGTYGQNFGDIETYEIAGDIFLSKDNTDGGTGVENAAERVLFPNGYADVNFVGIYEIALDQELQKQLHIMYNNDENVKYMVKQQVIEALKNTGTLMSAEEAYSSRRAEFIQLAREQSLKGLYKTEVTIDTVDATGGGKQFIKYYSVALDEEGNPIITKESLLAKYGITLPQFNVKDMDFDDKLEGLIDSRKDAQKAAQDAITEKANGEKLIAKEKATQEVDKIKLVTIADKDAMVATIKAKQAFDVAAYAAKEANEKKKATILAAEAKKQELLIADGLSELAKYQIDANKEMAIGVAAEWAKRDVPSIVVEGSGKGDASTLSQTYSMENLLLMMDKITNKKK